MNKEVKKILKDLAYSMRHDSGWVFAPGHATYSAGSGLDGLRDVIIVSDRGWDYGVIIHSLIRSAAAPDGADLDVGWWAGRHLRRIIYHKVQEQQKEKLRGSCSIILSALAHRSFCPHCGQPTREKT